MMAQMTTVKMTKTYDESDGKTDKNVDNTDDDRCRIR